MLLFLSLLSFVWSPLNNISPLFVYFIKNILFIFPAQCLQPGSLSFQVSLVADNNNSKTYISTQGPNWKAKCK